jgi:hypothetical protein
MAAISIAQYKVQPGKGPELVALRTEMKPLLVKHGLSSRLFLSLLAGPNAGTYSAVAEATDLSALATGLQNLFADPAYQSLNARLTGADGVATLVSFGQATEVAL